jgi:predicted metal-dependent peptidase
MERTRIRLMLDHPFFGILALSLQLVRKDSVGTLSTNGRSIFYNKAFIDAHSTKEKIFLFLHEIGHVMLLHMFRIGDRDKKLFNAACDFAVNDLLKDSIGTIMPDSALYNPKFHGMSAEEIYSHLMSRAASQQGQGQGQGQQDQGQQGQDQQDQQFPEEIEKMIAQAMKHGMVEDAPEDLTEYEVAATISSAAAVNEMSRGMKIGESTALGREIEKLTSKKVPWQALLQRFITETCQADYSWMKPNLKYRQVSRGFILPSLNREREINLAVVFDTSGSIDRQKCSRFFAEFLSMLNDIDFKELHVMSCSDRIFNPKVFNKGETVQYSPSGRGGTASFPVWDYLRSKNVAPNCVVYFTDLEIFEYGKDPGYPIVWIVDKEETDNAMWDYWESRVPFGEVVYMT